MADLSVTIEDLLRDPEPVHISTGRTRKDKKGKGVDEELVVYLRKPTEVERGVCLGAANAARRALRKLLLDPKTDEHKYLLREPLEDSDPDTLRAIWISGKLVERAQAEQLRSVEEREYVPEPEGDLVSPAEQDAYDSEVEKAEARRERSLADALTSIQRELAEEAKALGVDALLDAALPAHTETLVSQEWSRVLSDNMLARCVFKDKQHSKPYFKTVDQVRRLREQDAMGERIVKQLSNAINGLMISMEPSLGF